MSNDPWDEFPDSGFLRDSSGELMGRMERRSDGTDWITVTATTSSPAGTTPRPTRPGTRAASSSASETSSPRSFAAGNAVTAPRSHWP